MRAWRKVVDPVLAIRSIFRPLPKARIEVRRDGEVGVLTLKGAFLRQHADATRARVQELLDMDTTACILNLRGAVFLDKWPIGEIEKLLVELGKSKPRVRIVIVKPVARTFWWHEDWHDRLFGTPYEDEIQAFQALRQEQA